ncbi:hypothetical protein AB0M79_14210 [Polymorphospora sp. NPDC051019]|uniref:hypothetical protein n=1 Tax=Polymorphospora sp. NPDC051019 TaxID=3155725 RepID=UPI00343E0EA8
MRSGAPWRLRQHLRRLCLLTAVLVGMIIVHPGICGTCPADHHGSHPAGSVTVVLEALSNQHCAADSSGHDVQRCAALPPGTAAPETAIPATRLLQSAPGGTSGRSVGEPAVGAHLRPSLIRLAVSRT